MPLIPFPFMEILSKPPYLIQGRIKYFKLYSLIFGTIVFEDLQVKAKNSKAVNQIYNISRSR